MFDFVLDLIFPKRCVGCRKIGSYLCDNCFSGIEICTSFVCPVCNKKSSIGETHLSCKTSLGVDGLVCGVVYKGVVKRLLTTFKNRPYIVNLRLIMGRLFVETIAQNELFNKALYFHPIVVAVPLSPQQLKKRGYNQSDILSRYLAREFKLQNKSIFLKSEKDKIFQNSTVFLIDDLYITGKTLKEYARFLKLKGAKKVYGVTLAR